jgi:hypothetical protein
MHIYIYCVGKMQGRGILNEQYTQLPVKGSIYSVVMMTHIPPTTLLSLDCVSPTNFYVTCADETRRNGVSINLVRAELSAEHINTAPA